MDSGEREAGAHRHGIAPPVQRRRHVGRDPTRRGRALPQHLAGSLPHHTVEPVAHGSIVVRLEAVVTQVVVLVSHEEVQHCALPELREIHTAGGGHVRFERFGHRHQR